MCSHGESQLLHDCRRTLCSCVIATEAVQLAATATCARLHVSHTWANKPTSSALSSCSYLCFRCERLGTPSRNMCILSKIAQMRSCMVDKHHNIRLSCRAPVAAVKALYSIRWRCDLTHESNCQESSVSTGGPTPRRFSSRWPVM